MEHVIEELKRTLTEWKNQRAWGSIELEIHDGQVVLIRKETKQKFTSNGGFNREPGRIEQRGTER